MKKIFKKALLWSSFVPLLTSTIACSNLENKSNEQKYLNSLTLTKNNDEELEWENFLKRGYVDTILNSVFRNDVSARNAYIKEQKELGDEYLDELRTWVRYSNNIVFPYDKTQIFRFLFSSPKRNFATSYGSKQLSDLYKKNWLFFLYNLDKFVFLQFPNVATSDEANSDLIDEIESAKRIYDDFYISENNEIIDYVVQKYSIEIDEDDNSEIYEDRIFLLTKDGRILRFDISGNKSNNSLSKNNPPAIHQYLYSYPKIIKSNDKLNDFDLKKYIEVVKEWGDFDYKFSESKKALYTDEYGNREFRYTLINIKEK
ncbi:hypothetical protein AAW50_00930 [Mycoplasmopsis canis]|uniref:aromatic motif membrane protein n=1 Tax=Mycoplasmopsis canis TaxID=29555 RepID=UPI000624A981|nr:aromatic motif membrane protein [Mycoplasmopsis canis]AKF41003.1 hypothetical protein AAW50_00930 [Mycoplasmopsis canis]